MFRLCKVKFLLYFAVAKGFHFPKQPLAHSFHSLLRHLFRFEFAVLLFDCERYKEYPAILFLFKGCESLLFTLFRAQSFSSEKRVLSSPYFFRSSSILARPVKRIERRLLATISQRISTLPTRTASLPARVSAVYSILRERSPAGQP